MQREISPNTAKIIREFGLNPDQAGAVCHVDRWIQDTPGQNSRPPICLVHGPFGSGKSTLIVSIIHVLANVQLVAVKKRKPVDETVDFSYSG